MITEVILQCDIRESFCVNRTHTSRCHISNPWHFPQQQLKNGIKSRAVNNRADSTPCLLRTTAAVILKITQRVSLHSLAFQHHWQSPCLLGPPAGAAVMPIDPHSVAGRQRAGWQGYE